MYTVTIEVPTTKEEEIVQLLREEGYDINYKDNGYVIHRDENSEFETETGE